MNAPRSILATAAVALLWGVPAMACSPVFEDRSAATIRGQSKAVATDNACRALNLGVHDWETLGPAMRLDNGRVYQKINENDYQVLIADCNTREATILFGPATEVAETSCGPEFDYAPLTGKRAVFSLEQGKDLTDLVKRLEAANGHEEDPIGRFFRFEAKNYKTHKVGRKDQFDLLCGCKLYYPDSPGAKK